MRPFGFVCVYDPPVFTQNSFNLRLGSNFSFEGDVAVDDSVDIIAGIGLIPLITIIGLVNLGVSYRSSPSIGHLFVHARLLWLPVSLPSRLGGLVNADYRYSLGPVHLEGETGIGVNDDVSDSSGPFFSPTIRSGFGFPL